MKPRGQASSTCFLSASPPFFIANHHCRSPSPTVTVLLARANGPANTCPDLLKNTITHRHWTDLATEGQGPWVVGE
ncbi:hypothetical protein F0562_021939 [Nyssa sinensis]|uniref:Uncharacterized protein n=1 Tax=Nyssa sinensis TaxID=561372 RepID=A0A5J5BMH4_9ASTE|nr:hypothetical protein F0562_021939 [Nyssa sinensis]